MANGSSDIALDIGSAFTEFGFDPGAANIGVPKGFGVPEFGVGASGLGLGVLAGVPWLGVAGLFVKGISAFVQSRAAKRAARERAAALRRQRVDQARAERESRRRFGVQQKFAESKQEFFEEETLEQRRERRNTTIRGSIQERLFEQPFLLEGLGKLNAIKSGRAAGAEAGRL